MHWDAQLLHPHSYDTHWLCNRGGGDITGITSACLPSAGTVMVAYTHVRAHVYVHGWPLRQACTVCVMEAVSVRVEGVSGVAEHAALCVVCV